MVMPMPKIHIALEGMREQIVHALTAQNDELEQEISRAIHAAIEQMEWRSEIEAIVMEEVRTATRKAVEDFFRIGEGRAFVRQITDTVLRPLIPRSD